MTNNKVLITGACGYLGSALLQALDDIEQPLEINILDNFSTGSYSALTKLSPKHSFKLIESDILNPYALKTAMDGVDTVIHLAAMALTPMGLGRTKSAEQINHWGTVSTLETALKAKVSHFIYTSSTSVFGPVQENQKTQHFQPFGAYASSKFNAEKSIQSFIKRGLDCTILRLGTIYGLAPITRYDSLVNKFIVNATTKNALHIHGSGKQTRPLINITDAVQSILHSWFAPNFQKGLYNVFEDNYSVQKVADLITQLKPEVELKFVNQDFRNHYSFFIDKDLDTIPNYIFQSSMTKTLEEAFNQFKNFNKINYHV